jgi:Cu/Ag efflux pump CusA
VGNLFEEQKVFDVVVWGVPEIRQSEYDVHGLLIDTPRGGLVPLGDVAEVRITPNPNVIYHESAQSYIDVVADASGGSVSSVAADVDDALEGVEFPLEYHAEVLGGFREQQAANARLLAVAVAVAIAVFLLLQAAFTSWRLAILSFLTLSAAIVGGLVAVLLTGGTLTLGSVAGFLAILSIAMRFTVVLLRRYQTLERDRGMPFGSELVVQGTRERLGPIVATAVVGAAALLPVLFAGTTAGMEIVRPMAVVLIGGLATTVVLTIVVLPAVYLRFGFVAEPDTSADELFVLNVPETDTVGDREG